MHKALTRALLGLAALFLAFSWHARAGDTVTTPRVEARLVPEVTSIPAGGGTISVALHQRMQPEWHTYWRNPGESGEPTQLSWTLPAGFAASDIRWPAPERIAFGELANYGYSGEVLLRADITVPSGLTPGTAVTLAVNATWLACKDICVPEEGRLEITLPVSASAPVADPAWTASFADARAREPRPATTMAAAFHATPSGDVQMKFSPSPEQGIAEGALFFPFSKGLIKASAPQVPAAASDGFTVSVPAGWRFRDPAVAATIGTVDGILVLGAGDGSATRAWEVSLRRSPVPLVAAGAAPQIPLLQAILFAVLGGLILNLMPCVFPILSMKALALVKAGHADHPWTDGIAYLLGVMTTFAGLAATLLWLRGLGEDVGWGFQLQSPLSVTVLAIILLLIGLNLSGVFNVGSSVQDTGSSLSARGGLVGAFFTGVLAVVVAAPCTAPFMGAAMSFAFVQPPAVTITIFLALGLGLALPWVIFSFSPALIRLLPRPGAWMERFKQFLAFPMYGAAAWLVWVLSQQVSPSALFQALAILLLVAFAAWAYGVVQARRAMSEGFFLSALLCLAGLASAVALLAQPFEGRTPEAASGEATSSAAFANPYSAARLAETLARGEPAFVNLTAAWCVSCLYNERVALSSERVREAFRKTGTTYLLGDWTNRNPEISALLRQHGRDGVPLYLYFPKGSAEPRVLPQILTEQMMIETLGAAE